MTDKQSQESPPNTFHPDCKRMILGRLKSLLAMQGRSKITKQILCEIANYAYSVAFSQPHDPYFGNVDLFVSALVNLIELSKIKSEHIVTDKVIKDCLR